MDHTFYMEVEGQFISRVSLFLKCFRQEPTIDGTRIIAHEDNLPVQYIWWPAKIFLPRLAS